MSDPDETLTPSEALDEDELRADPLEAGIDPPDHWSAANRFGTTPREVREGESFAQRLAEEEPDVAPEPGPERPLAATPVADLDESVEDAPADDETFSSEGSVRPRHSEPDPAERFDYASGSVADAIRRARHS